MLIHRKRKTISVCDGVYHLLSAVNESRCAMPIVGVNVPENDMMDGWSENQGQQQARWKRRVAFVFLFVFFSVRRRFRFSESSERQFLHGIFKL